MYAHNPISAAILIALYELIVTAAQVERLPCPDAASIGYPTLVAVDGANITSGGITTLMAGHILAAGSTFAVGRGLSPEEAYFNWKLSQ